MDREFDPSSTSLAELDAMRETCRRLVVRRAALSGAVAAVPLPLLDSAADLGLLMRLLPRISHEFALSQADIERLDPESRAVVYAAVKSVGETLVGQALTRGIVLSMLRKLSGRIAAKQASRIVPLVGQAASASISFALMRHIGHKHVDDCYRIARRRAEARLFGQGAVVIDLPANAK